MNEWTKEDIIHLIEVYKSQTALYAKSSDENLRDKYKQQQAYLFMADIIASFRPNTSAEEIKLKVEGLRNVYIYHRKRVLEAQNRSDGKTYTPSLWYYKHMTFLDKHLQFPSYDDINNIIIGENQRGYSDDETPPPEEVNQAHSPMLEHDYSARKRKREVSETVSSTVASSSAEYKVNGQDEYNAFATFVAHRLRRIGGEKSRIMQDQIINMIMQAK